MKKSNIVSIDLRSFFGSLLEQWICVVIFAVITAVLMAGVMSVKSNREAQDEAEMYSELSLMSYDEKLDTLPELDRVRVSLALMQKNLIEQQEAYYSGSIVNKMLEEGSLPVLHMRWIVSDNDNIQAINTAYGIALTDTETASAVRPALAASYADTEDVYVSELITYKSSDALDVYVVLPEGSKTDTLSNALKDRVAAVQAQIESEFGKHKMTFVSEEETTLVDDERIAAKTENDITYKDLKESYTALLLEFDYTENVVFDSIVAPDESRTVYNDPGIRLSPKMLAAGFAVGIIVYVFIYLVYIVLSSKVHDASVISETLGVINFGIISKYTHKGFASVIHNKAVYKMLRKKSLGDKAVESAADSAVSVIKRENCSKVLFVKPGMKADYSEEVKNLVAKISKASGVEVKAVDKVADEKTLDGFDAVVLGVCSDSTGYSELSHIAELCCKKVLGGVYFD